MSTTGNTLSNLLDEYFAMRFIDKKKYYSGYLICAKNCWKILFRNTMWSTQSVWQQLKPASPYNYIDVPPDLVRLFTVSELDKNNNIVPLFYNSQFNILTPPTLPVNCGCTDNCGCGNGLCDDINSLTKTTTLLFTVNGVDYYQTDYAKLCPNGQVIQYSEIPTKKYNTYAGDGGDYNSDYLNDWLIGNPPFSDFTIVTQTTQKILCNLELAPCGCPLNTPANINTFVTCCGAFAPCFSTNFQNYCQNVYLNTNIDTNCKGQVKISECGTRIYYIPYPQNVITTSIDSNMQPQFVVQNTPLPNYLLVNYQTSGEDCNTMVEVPELAVEAMFAGIDYYSKRFNNMYSRDEKNEAKYHWVDMQNKLILDLNAFSLIILSNIQDSKIQW